MVKAEDSWLFQQHSDWHLPKVNCTSRMVSPNQKIVAPPCMNPCTFSANVAPGFSASGLPSLNAGQEIGDFGLPYCLPALTNGSPPFSNQYQSQFPFPVQHGMKTIPNNATKSSQKRFLIIDQSENHARFFLSSFGSSCQNPISAPIGPVRLTRDVELVPIMEQMFSIKPTNQGAYNEEPTLGEGSEFHEDTEEINALLYSDDDEHDYNDGEGGEDGEVTSTYHSPLAVKVNLENYEEEVASSDSSTKRQRLLDGGYKKSSVVDATSSVKFDRPYEYGNDAESTCARARTKGKVMDSKLGTTQLKKDKIYEKVRFLENIIPGSKGKEPLSIIDEAISYLKSLKLKAKAHGLGYS